MILYNTSGMIIPEILLNMVFPNTLCTNESKTCCKHR